MSWRLTIGRQPWKEGKVFEETSYGKSKFLNTVVMRGLLVIDHLFILKSLFFDFKEREREIDLFSHLFIHSLVDPCMCPDIHTQGIKHTTLAYKDDTITN